MRTFWRMSLTSWCLIAALTDSSFARQSTGSRQSPPKPSTGKKAEWEILNEQGLSLYKAGKPDEAEPILKEALEAAEKERGPDSLPAAQVLHELGALTVNQKRYAEAEPLFERALAIAEKKAGKDSPNMAPTLQGLATALAGQQKYTEAEPVYRRALAAAEKSYGPDDPRTAEILKGYSWLLRKVGKGEEAAQMDSRARKITGEPEPTPTRPSAVPTPTRFEQAEAAYFRGDVAGALKTFRELADEGDAHAQAVLGDMYLNGQGVPKDPATAVQWYRKSAEQGWPGGQLNLGVCYEKGLGVNKDLGEAFKWYRKAAERLAVAQKFVGDMYAKGLGVPKDWEEAERWFAKAAAGGDQEAKNLMNIPASERRNAYEKSQKAGPQPIDMGLRGVQLQDWIGTLRWAVPKGVRVTLGTEEVTSENGKQVLARLEKEQGDLLASMEKLGVPRLAGDYLLNEPPKDGCGSFQGKKLSYPIKVSIAQTKNSIELKSPEVYGCGVAVGNLLVMKAQPCEGTTPMRLLGVVSEKGIDDLSFLESVNAPGLCHLGSLTRAAP